jgi:hypothetical protein
MTSSDRLVGLIRNTPDIDKLLWSSSGFDIEGKRNGDGLRLAAGAPLEAIARDFAGGAISKRTPGAAVSAPATARLGGGHHGNRIWPTRSPSERTISTAAGPRCTTQRMHQLSLMTLMPDTSDFKMVDLLAKGRDIIAS